MTDLPYLVEYAKSSRSSCQNCRSSIIKDTLRFATVVQSPIFDGNITKWYHPNCFFAKQRPKSIADIANFDGIRWEDQESVKKSIEEGNHQNVAAPAKKGKKRGKGADASSDFSIQYAKSSRAMCRGCEEKIMKEEIRISKKDFESEEARRYGGLDRWYHLECFVKLRKELEFFDQADSLAGIKSLSKEDQANVKKELPKISNDDAVVVKKLKEEPEDAEEENKLKEQNKQLFAMRDTLSSLNKKELREILETNKQQVPEGVSAMLDMASDLLVFGTLKPCPKCSGQLKYVSGLGYKCTGDLTEWTKCEYTTQDPKRQKCSVPDELKDTYKALAFKPKVVKRLIKVTAPSTSSAVKKEDEVDAGPKILTKPKPLKNMQFVILGSTEKSKDTLKKEIALLGGSVTTKIHEHLAAVISNPKEVKKMNKKMEEAKVLDIQVVSEDLVEEAKDYTELAIALIKKKTISDWGGDVKNRLATVIEKSSSSTSKSKSKFEKSLSGKVKLQVKGGGTVDMDSGLEDCAHVYQDGKNKYNATLGITDIQAKKNSYYKLQILKHDKLSKYWLFRSWGRIGTTIGDTKLESMPLNDCIERFLQLYEEKSGNSWHNRKHFVKVPHKMYPIDIDQGNDEDTSKLLDSNIKSHLEKPVQDLIRLIFNVENMKKVMLEFEIDMDKMPLGKISKKQIQKAYSVLTELQEIVATSVPERTTLIDASNRFYTLIPHNFGISGPKILETVEEIKMKCEMLEALLEMEVAYSLLHTDEKTKEEKNPLDVHYEQLKTKIEVLDKSSKDFEVIKQYVNNTHAATHSHYELEIEDVFVIKRQGEDQRYKPFKKLPNKKLLWHGSRTTNFAGILSQGLRIAPPEAPVTGYMFGKGIYFADMVSKSANYCCTNTQNPTGLLLLCEVALGNMYERYEADYIEKLPKDKHSTMGRGQTQPDPSIVHKMDDSVEVPYGPPVQVKLHKKSALLYNEYIVYDTAQVKARYLVKMNFKYKI
ncbi:PREDICTED: poly [ADP-ribose] polymerase [Polistes dominula]|uniref:Poly [ADP-ribose] polymerase n=1 Tax=Polistes dominula TaxID=743375 RepID=A0ABM1IV65_POLDO|nr:PREDICTED: poly [ADP-ribose] polymerase [Polistes dominula]